MQTQYPETSRRQSRRHDVTRQQQRPKSFYDSRNEFGSQGTGGVQHSQSESFVPQQFDQQQYPPTGSSRTSGKDGGKTRTGSHEEMIGRNQPLASLQRGSWDGSKGTPPVGGAIGIQHGRHGRDRSLDTAMSRRGYTLPNEFNPAEVQKWSRDSSVDSLQSDGTTK